jgi:hypothetical protein
MSIDIRWFLAQGLEEEKEVGCPLAEEEIVILSVTQPWGGLAEITFARAGNDDLLSTEITEVAAHALYHKVESVDDVVAIPWMQLSQASRRTYIAYAQTMLAEVTEYMREKREERGQLKDT